MGDIPEDRCRASEATQYESPTATLNIGPLISRPSPASKTMGVAVVPYRTCHYRSCYCHFTIDVALEHSQKTVPPFSEGTGGFPQTILGWAPTGGWTVQKLSVSDPFTSTVT
jgi:hypothetical protein